MNKEATRDISFDRLNALVDRELDPIEEGRILDAIRSEPELEQLACELRTTKELVRHAYSRETPTRRRTPGGLNWNWRWMAVAAVALVAFGAGGGWVGHTWYDRGLDTTLERLTRGPDAVPLIGASDHVVLHISSSAPKRVSGILDEAEGMLHEARAAGRPIAVEIIANNTGLDVLRAGDPSSSRVLALHTDYPNLTLVACGQTIERLRAQGVSVHLIPDTTVATSALDQIVKRIRQGWTYVRA
jgi:intracellular sulfur oxidation DsrE/DsrF family protein